MRGPVIQRLFLPTNGFTSGIMDVTRMRGRTDLPAYQGAAQEMNNVLIHPQGGFYDATGSRRLADLSAYNNFRLVAFVYSDAIQYLLVFVPSAILVYGADTDEYLTTITTTMTAKQLEQMDYSQSANSLVVAHRTMAPMRLQRGATPTSWTWSAVPTADFPLYNFAPTEVSPAATLTPSGTSGVVKLTASAAVFSATDKGSWVTGNGGEARITKYISTTVVEARITIPFIDTTAIASGVWSIERGYEVAWSATRGYPGAVAYFGDSLLFGGTTQLPDVVWKSAIGEEFNFDETRAREQDAMSFVVRAERVNQIRALVAVDSLIILTSDAEFYVDGTLTPALDFVVRKQEERGCREGAKPVVVDGRPVYLDRLANTLRDLSYSEIEAKYNSTPLNQYCPNILNEPKDLAVRKPAGDKDADIVYVVNGDGTWACLNTMLTRGVIAWTTGSSPDAEMLNVVCVDQKVYAVFKRTFGMTTKRYLERLDEELTLHCATVYDGSPTDTVSVPSEFNGKTLQIVADGTSHPDVVAASGQVVLNAEYSEIIVGIDPGISVVTLPPIRELGDGTMSTRVRRIAGVTLGLTDTANIVVNDIPVRFRSFGEDLFDAPSPLYTGRKNITMLGGYKRDPVLRITRRAPMHVHVTDLVTEVQV